MQVSEKYDLPFDSEFDWRVTLISTMTDLARRSIIDMVQQYKEDSQNLEWKDRDGVLWFAFEENLFVKLKDEMIARARPQINS